MKLANVTHRSGKINVKALVILVGVVLVLGAAAVIGRDVRRQIIAGNAREAAEKALNEQDWPEACKHLNHYLNRKPDDVEMLEKYAEANLKVRPQDQGRLLAAMDAYRRLLRERPADREYTHKLANLYNGVGRFSDAAIICERRLEVEPTDAQASLALGMAHYKLRDLAATSQVLGKLLETHPDQVQAYAILASASMDLVAPPDRQQAATWLDRAVEANPDSAAALLHRARFRRKVSNDVAGARADLDRASAASISSPTEALVLADEWMALGALDDARRAIQAAEQAASLESTGTDEAFNAGDFAVAKFHAATKLALMVKDPQECRALADHAVASLPATHRTVFLPWVVDLYLHAGRVEDARTALESFREQITEQGDRRGGDLEDKLTIAEAAVLTAEKRPYEVIAVLEPFLASNPETAIARKLHWLALQRTEQTRRARAALEAYLNLEPEDVDALRAAARDFLESAPDKAVDYATRALRADPTHLNTRLLRLEARLGLARQRKAVEEARAVEAELAGIATSNPDNATAHLLHARVLSSLGRSEDAQQALQRAQAQADNPVPALMDRARLLAQNGQEAQAEALCREAIDANPDSTVLRITLARFQFALGKPDAARQTLEEAVGAFDGRDRTEIELAFADFLLSQGKSAEAVEPLLRVAEREPDNLRVRAALLDREEVASDPELARRLVDEMRTIEGAGGLHWQLEDVRLRLRGDDWRGEADLIVETLAECLRRDPGWSRAAVMLGHVQSRLGRTADALRTYETAYARDPDRAPLSLLDALVSALIREARFPDARRILSRYSDDAFGPRLRMHRVQVAMGEGDSETAIEELERRVEEAPSDADSMILLALMTYDRSEEGERSAAAERAFELLDRAAEVPGDAAKITQARVYLLHAEGRDDEAVALATDYIEDRQDREAYLFRGALLRTLDRVEDAERDFREAANMPPPAPAGYIALGDFLQETGRASDALKAWRQALTIEPQQAAAELRIIATLLAGTSSEREEGIRLLDEFQRRHPDDPRGLYLAARAEIAAGSFGALNRAARRLEDAVRIDPQFAPAHLELLRIARSSGSPSKIEAVLRAARRSGIEDPELDLAEARLRADEGQTYVAKSRAREVLEQYPNHVPARLLIAGLMTNSGDLESARAIVEEALRIDPDHAQARLALAEIRIAQGEQAEAIAELAEYCDGIQQQAAVPALLRLAFLQSEQGDFASAAASLDKAERLAPGNIDVGRARIDLLAAGKHFGDIAALADRETSTDGGRMEIITRAASALSASPEDKHRGQALTLFERALAEAPDDPRIMLAVGQLRYLNGRVREAVEAYEKVLDADRDNVTALNDLAWILATELNDPEQGLKLADRGLGREPDNANLLDTRGVIHYHLRNYDQSRRDLEACANLTNVHPSTKARALFHLARTLVAAGDHVSARSRLDEARRIDESNGVFTDQEHQEIAQLSGTISE